jgi:exodeoxyribonuclease V alpha subunit
MLNPDAKQTPKIVSVSGRVGHLYFSSPTFSAGWLVVPGDDSIRFAGKFMVQEGDQVTFKGEWTDSKFGPQLQVSGFEYDLPVDRAGLANYIARHPRIKGIGPAKARTIAEKFGDDFDRGLDERTEEMARVAHVGVPVIEKLRDEWFRTRSFNVANTWLASFELTHHQISTLVKKYGNSVVAVFKEDPYRLIREIDGYGFKKVDKIARKMGTPKDHPSRLRGGILYCVSQALDSGHCWTEYEELVDEANRLLVMDTLDSRDRISEALDRIVQEKELACEPVDGRQLISRPDIRRMEFDLADLFTHGRDKNPCRPFMKAPDILLQEHAGDLNEGQRRAVESVLAHTFTVITGGAGSGKTYTVRALCNIFQGCDLSVTLCAPTGKAAKRLEESTGRPASTIHRLLEYNGMEFQFDGALDTDLIVVDEVSMVDVRLFWHLMRAVDLDKTAVVFVGDHHQLPPVGPGNVLRDLIATKAVPVALLDEIVRQAGILRENSAAVLRGQVAASAPVNGDGLRPWYRVAEFTQPEDLLGFVHLLYQDKLQDELGLDLIDEVQLLTPTRKGPLGVNALNVELQRIVQKKLRGIHVDPPPANRRPRPLLGDKVIQRRNNYELDVMNGTVGRVVAVDQKTGDLTVGFDGRSVKLHRSEGHLQDIDLAYALTIHQTQGSEFPVAIVIVHKSHSFQHHRNLLYTGVTRAQRSTIILGDHWGIRNCAGKVHVNKRRTWLSLIAGRWPNPPGNPAGRPMHRSPVPFPRDEGVSAEEDNG